MSIIFKIRMIFGGDDEFLRDYELIHDTSLLDFHRFICDDCDYDPMSMSSFFLSNERWEQEQEFTLMDMGGDVEGAPIAMEAVTLGQILHRNHDRLIYVFDPLSDRAMFLELMGTGKPTSEADYPRINKSEGMPPQEFLVNMDDNRDSIFDEVMDDFNDFESDDLYDDDF